MFKNNTSTNLCADEIHSIGLIEVAKIEERYKKDVLLPLGFKSFDAFVNHI